MIVIISDYGYLLYPGFIIDYSTHIIQSLIFISIYSPKIKKHNQYYHYVLIISTNTKTMNNYPHHLLTLQSTHSFNYKYLFISRYQPYLGFMIVKYAWEQYINFRQLLRTLVREKPP